MSPEQARGKPVDSRSDIWAFGVLLFEMLTGRELFQGETVSDVLAAVLTREPDWTTLPAATPLGVHRTLRRCLVRQPADRLHHIADARIELRDAEPEAEPREGTGGQGPGWRTTAALAAAAAVLAVGATLWLRGAPASETSVGPVRFEVPAPAGSSLSQGLALSPDGRSVVFAARGEGGRPQLWLRSLDSVSPRRLEGTEGARLPFWSPDGRRVGFFAGNELVVVDLIGGSRQVLAPTASGSMVRGATWGADDVIVYAPSFGVGLMRVSAAGARAPEPATRLDPEAGHGTHRFPSFLPDGRHFVFYASGGSGVEPGEICIGELGSLQVRRLTRASSAPVFLAPHFLVFARGEALVAQQIDLDRLEMRGDPVPLGVAFPGSISISGYRPLSSAAGVVAYRVPAASGSRVVWVDRAGREIGTVAEPTTWNAVPRLSPDGQRLTLSVNDGGDTDGDVWVIDTKNDNRTRLTYDGRDDWTAAWSPDGRQIAFCSIGASASGLFLADPGRPGETRPLWQPEFLLNPAPVWLPDGDGILIDAYGEDNQLDIWRVPLPGDGEPAPFIATPFSEHDADVSPDGRWIAFVSNSSGREEVYVRAMDGEGATWTISTEGGTYPAWRRDGRELFFVDTAGRIVAVPTSLTPSFSKGTPVALFDGRLEELSRQYDIAPDGQRFILAQRAPSSGDPIVVVLGWADELAPTR